jgi:CheY-like chemotaxis protein
MRALVVDDREENRYLLCQLLRGHGYAVQEADQGAQALELARAQPPDLVVSDLLMPVMDGYTLLRNWKADDTLCRIPFIVYTATYTEPKDEQLALDMGADAFIIKPAEPDVFMQRIWELLTRARAGTLPVSAPALGRGGGAQAVQRSAGEEAGEEKRPTRTAGGRVGGVGRTHQAPQPDLCGLERNQPGHRAYRRARGPVPGRLPHRRRARRLRAGLDRVARRGRRRGGSRGLARRPRGLAHPDAALHHPRAAARTGGVRHRRGAHLICATIWTPRPNTRRSATTCARRGCARRYPYRCASTGKSSAP